MDWTPVLAKLRKSEQALWHQLVQAYDSREWTEALRISDLILKQVPNHAGLLSSF